MGIRGRRRCFRGRKSAAATRIMGSAVRWCPVRFRRSPRCTRRKAGLRGLRFYAAAHAASAAFPPRRSMSAAASVAAGNAVTATPTPGAARCAAGDVPEMNVMVSPCNARDSTPCGMQRWKVSGTVQRPSQGCPSVSPGIRPSAMPDHRPGPQPDQPAALAQSDRVRNGSELATERDRRFRMKGKAMPPGTPRACGGVP